MAKKYYWMKLREDFFDDDAIEWLEEKPKGKEYSLFYLKLCLKSLKTNGILIRSVGNILVPYDVKKLAEITKTDFDTAVVAMNLFKTIGLVEVLEGGEICLPRMEEMIGSETDKAAIMRRIREQKKLASGNSVTEMLPECSTCETGNNVTTELPESYQNVTQRLDIRDRDKEIDKISFVDPPVQRVKQPVKKSKSETMVGDFEYQCVDMLISSCLSSFPNAKVPSTDQERMKWAVEIERMKRIDKRSEQEIIEALTFATTDSFWKCNIRSTKKFREKFETLIVRARSRTNQPQGRRKPQNRFNNFHQRNYDFDAYERQLLGAENPQTAEGVQGEDSV